VDDFIHYVTQTHADEFGTFEWGVKVEVRDVHVMNCMPGLEMTLLNRILATSMSAVGVATSLG
jgi:hypothetical protein